MEAQYVGGESSSNVTFLCVRVMEEPQLERDQPISPEVDILDDLVGAPIPHVEVAAVFPILDVRRVEPLQEGLGLAPLATDHDVLSRLVPKVVAERRGVSRRFPVLWLDLESLSINQDKASYSVVGVSGTGVQGQGFTPPKLPPPSQYFWQSLLEKPAAAWVSSARAKTIDIIMGMACEFDWSV